MGIIIVIPNFKSHNIIMSARVYCMKTVNCCKDVSIMSLQDEQRRRTSLLCLLLVYCNFLFYISTTVCSQNINKQIVIIADENLTDYSFLSIGITILNQRIILKDDIEFVTEFPCLLGHPVLVSNI